MNTIHSDVQVTGKLGPPVNHSWPKRARLVLVMPGSYRLVMRGAITVDVRTPEAMDALVAAIRDAVLSLHGACTCSPETLP